MLARALVIRQEHTDMQAKGATYNAIKYNPLGSADFVNPNFDVAYLEAWFAVDDSTPVYLEVPETKGRYYTAQILDEWGEVIANINERTFASKPFGRFALVKPGSKLSIPPDVGRIELHSSKAKLLARVELRGDPEGALRLQHAFKVTTPRKPVIEKAVPLAMFDNKDLIGVEIFDDLDAKLVALDVEPYAAEMQQKARAVAAYVATGRQARAEVDAQVRKASASFRETTLTQSAAYGKHWSCVNAGGNYAGSFLHRTALNYSGIWANVPFEVVYFAAARDAADQPLNGSKSYLMHFPASALPETVVNAYWSVILVGVPDYRVVPNSLKRYNFNTYSSLKKEADGSLKIAIGPKPVAGVAESNWLPSAEGKPFSLTFRAYVPKDSVKSCDWAPPPVTLVQ
jgi:hypothetical protein